MIEVTPYLLPYYVPMILSHMRIGCHCVARSRHRVLYCINLGGATWQGFDIETQRKMEPVMMKKYHDELLKCAPASAPAHSQVGEPNRFHVL